MRNNRKLYETIMSKVAKEVKKALNEAYDDNGTYYDPDKITPEFKANLNYGKKVQPTSKEKLKKIIEDTIAIKGLRCDLNFIDTSKITDMSGLFFHSDFNGDISKWDVSNVTSMRCMFLGSRFNGDISKWNVSRVKDMDGMFKHARFNGDISNWDVSNVRYMSYMFADSKFNGDISNWDVRNVIDMFAMFMWADFNGDISKWETKRVRCCSRFANKLDRRFWPKFYCQCF